MARATAFLAFLALLIAGPWVSSVASAQTPSKILDNGDDAQRLVFAVLGDGYSSTQQAKFASDVNKVIISGALGFDFYAMNRQAFNVYRIDLVSTVSGVSTSSGRRSTALNTTYAGSTGSCWITEGANTVSLIAGKVPSTLKIDYYVVLVNTNTMDYGGCSYGSFMYLTPDNMWSPSVAAHEYGHGIANLYDEYGSSRSFTGTRDALNCSSNSPGVGIRWASKMPPGTSIPTTFNPSTMNDNQTVGAFKGCDNFANLYRPVENCRMKTVDHVFCPVCLEEMTKVVAPHKPDEGGRAPSKPTGVRILNNLQTRMPRFPSRSLSVALQRSQQNAAQPYLNLLLQVFSDGRIKILRAAEGRGDVVASRASADALYEVTRGGQTVAAGPLPQGFMSVRRYNPPYTGNVDSQVAATSTTVSITIPNTTRNDAIAGTLGLTLYQLTAGVPLQEITVQAVATLKARNQLMMTAALSRPDFASGVRQLPYTPPPNPGR